MPIQDKRIFSFIPTCVFVHMHFDFGSNWDVWYFIKFVNSLINHIKNMLYLCEKFVTYTENVYWFEVKLVWAILKWTYKKSMVWMSVFLPVSLNDFKDYLRELSKGFLSIIAHKIYCFTHKISSHFNETTWKPSCFILVKICTEKHKFPFRFVCFFNIFIRIGKNQWKMQKTQHFWCNFIELKTSPAETKPRRLFLCSHKEVSNW